MILVGAFILAGCSKDDKDYALANHTHTGSYYQTIVRKVNGITLTGAGTSMLAGAYNGLKGMFDETFVILVYECVRVQNSVATWIQWPYTATDRTYSYTVSDDGEIDFANALLDEDYVFTQNLTLGTVKIVIIPQAITISMKSHGIDLRDYDEVAKYCNLPADDVASLSVVIPE